MKYGIAYMVLIVSGCSTWHGTGNRFQSNSFLGYVEPIGHTESHILGDKGKLVKIENPRVTPSSLEGSPLLIEKGECVAIDLAHGGWSISPFEPWHEKLLTEKSGVRSEVAITTAIYERVNSTSLVIKEGEKYPTSTEYNVLINDGQLIKRPFPFEDAPVYGPRTYNGGDLIFQLSMSELDEEEIKNLTTDILDSTQKLSEELPESANTENFYSATARALTDATLNISGAGIVAVGIDAVELFAKAYGDLHKSDDAIMQHTFSLQAPNETENLSQPILRSGYYPLVRVSTNGTIENLKNLEYDPVKPEMVYSDSATPPIWLSFRVRKVKGCTNKS
ncbi:hypothetical protein [Vibrio coralliirubri]|uniref:hypothetical protein n=1 Tax=Vibrio coralliirubri TaxID=1516159 RepID=UPI00068212C2|nr:hypothetical protein [Vibrio coralliirubri]